VWWIKAKKYWNIASLWCRQHWRWVLFGLAFIIVYIFGRRNSRTELIQAKLALKHYEQEKKAIEKAYEKEMEMKEEAKNKYDNALKTVNEKYAGETSSLGFKKENEIRDMLKKAKNNPDEIDKILENELGIKKQ